MKTKKLFFILSLSLLVFVSPNDKYNILGSEESGWNEHAEEFTVTCSEVPWDLTEYVDRYENVLGELYIVDGKVEISYTGEYWSCRHSSGVMGGSVRVGNTCVSGWGIYCTPHSNPCAGTAE